MIHLTDAARQKVGEFVAEAGADCRGVRIRAARVGSHTFRYQIHLVREADTEENDTRLPFAGFTVYLDPQTAQWMEGSTIDYLTLDTGSGFQIDNPAALPNWADPVCQKVQKVIDEKVTPVVGAHGGWVELDRVEGNTAYVRLGGGCQGCASASFTLSQGIASAITSEVEEINQVVDETNHVAGDQPYYTP
jgi:Fe/S biogenesis protein NfuA